MPNTLAPSPEARQFHSYNAPDFTPTMVTHASYNHPRPTTHEVAPTQPLPTDYYTEAQITYGHVTELYGRHSPEAALVRAYVAQNFPDKPQPK